MARLDFQIQAFAKRDKELYEVLRGLADDVARQQGMYKTGEGSPEGKIAARTNTMYLDITAGGSPAWWVKKTGSGNTGWVLLVNANAEIASNRVVTSSIVQTNVNRNGSFENAVAIALVGGSVIEIGSVTITENGGSTEIWASGICNPTAGVCNLELHDGNCTGTQLGYAGNFTVQQSASFHVIITAGVGARTFTLCGGLSAGGAATVTYRKMLVGNRKV